MTGSEYAKNIYSPKRDWFGISVGVILHVSAAIAVGLMIWGYK
jgi:hypothetical protein